MNTDLVLVGRVARPHGIRGHVIVNPETDFPEERFRVGVVLLVGRPGAEPTPRRIGSVRFHQGRPILGLEGIESIDEAEPLAGLEIRLPAAAVGRLPEGTFHHHELIGCEVRDRSDALLGRVSAVEGPMERSRLVVKGERGEIQIPMTSDICISIDPSAARIVVDPPEGLLDLNVTEARQRRAQPASLRKS
jgi:16S rRNA processing protein RimM